MHTFSSLLHCIQVVCNVKILICNGNFVCNLPASLSPSASATAFKCILLAIVSDCIVTYSFVNVASVLIWLQVSAVSVYFRNNIHPSFLFTSRQISTSLWHAIKILCLHSILNRCTRNCICTYPMQFSM